MQLSPLVTDILATLTGFPFKTTYYCGKKEYIHKTRYLWRNIFKDTPLHDVQPEHIRVFIQNVI